MDIEDVQTVAVLGAGNMGHGIAEVAAIAGYSVRLRDIEEELVQDGYDSIEWSLGKLAEHDQLTEEEADAALERVTPVVDLGEAVGDADVVIEAVPERMDIKREVYAEVEEHAPEEAVFASNTSSLSITDLSEATDRPEQFCGMHFFNPPVRMDLVEVISGAHTEEATLELIEHFAESMDKTPVRVRKDSPGFIVNRVLIPLLNEAAWLVENEEATIAEVDATAKYDMGLPMGAFELADQIGIDVAMDVLDYVEETLGEAYAPCPLLEGKVEAGEIGKKAGQGFYDYENGGVDIPNDAGRDDIATRLTAVMANEVAKLVEGDVADPPAIDEAMQLGAGFPEGPASLADEAGLETLADALADRYEATGEARYEPADLLVAYAEEGRDFYETGESEGVDYDAITVERDGEVGRITLDRAHRMNTVTEGMLDELDAAIDELDGDEGVRAILLRGDGDRAFSAGADVQSFAAGGGDPMYALDLSRKGQRVFGKLESADAPVVAGIDGYCLGGGMELATACDFRVASERSEFGQPEQDLGLLPAWGGTQRLRHLIGEARAKEVIFTADRYDPETLADYGFLNDVVGNDELEEHALELARDLAAGPPIAQAFTKRAMLAGRADTDAGLEAEAEGFGLLMTTDDLMEGVSAFMEDREPEFEGE
ncbi:MAG: 3-hydroxyacyl-CoA dehydrogenase NAD-binding domain-containing protein [Halobacteriales archaeon]